MKKLLKVFVISIAITAVSSSIALARDDHNIMSVPAEACC